MRRFTFPIITIVLVGLLAFLPLLIDKASTINLIILIFLFISLASSWNILGGYTGQTSLGHAAFFGLGALATRMLWIKGFSVFPSMLAGAGLATAFAALIGIPAFKLKGVYFAIGTLALGQILNITVGNLFPNVSGLPVDQLVAYDLTPRFYLTLGLAAVTILASYFLVNSRAGLGMMAVREQEEAAESLGVSALKHKLIALLISAFLTGLAGGAFAFYHVSYYYQFPFTPVWSFDTLTMVYIGGQGTIIGPIIGAIFFVFIREFLALNVGEYHLIVFGTLFVLVVLFLPGGLMEGWEKIQKAAKKLSRLKQPEKLNDPKA